jgi:hypothetical protein
VPIMNELSRRDFLNRTLTVSCLAGATFRVAAVAPARTDPHPFLSVARAVLGSFTQIAPGPVVGLATLLHPIDADTAIDGWIYWSAAGAVAAGRVHHCGHVRAEALLAMDASEVTCRDLGARIGIPSSSCWREPGATALAAPRIRVLNHVRGWRLALALANPAVPHERATGALALWRGTQDSNGYWTLHAANAAHEQA